jgi:hypothetical protein
MCESLRQRCPQMQITVMLLGAQGRGGVRSDTLNSMRAHGAVQQISDLTRLVLGEGAYRLDAT